MADSYHINIIAVVGKNRAIGINNQLLWHLPGDLAHFKEITFRHPVIMGYRTYQSLGSKPLPGRKNIVLSDRDIELSGDVVVVRSIDAAIAEAQKADREIFFIGGGMVYAQAVPIADKLYLTVVDASPEADTYFPDYSSFKRRLMTGKGRDGEIKYEFWEMTK